MNKKLQSKDEKTRPSITYGEGKTDLMYRYPKPKKLPILKDKGKIKPSNLASSGIYYQSPKKLKDERGVEEWENKLDDLSFEKLFHSTFDSAKLKDFIRSLIAQSRKEWQEEQNKVVNSGRKLFQEGQKAERERIIREVEKMKIDYTDVIRESGSAIVASELRTREIEHNSPIDDILHILKGEK